MTSKIPDDLLSAFVDRELTPAEEAAANARLQASSQARHELQDYQRLSEWLHALPRQTVPPEFASAVMQRAERETLIPLEAAGIVECDKHLQPPSRRAWILTAIGAMAAAVTALFFIPLPSHQDERDLAMEEAAVQPPKQVRFAQAHNTPAAPAPRPVLLAGKPAQSDFRVAGRALPAATNRSELDRQHDKVAAAATPPQATAAYTHELVFPTDLKKAKSGDVIEAIEQAGDQVAVVRLTVVNQTAGLDGLQSLLVRNASRPVERVEKEKLLKERFNYQKGAVSVEGQKTSVSPGDVVCVFVEASREQLAGALKDVQNESQIRQAQLTNTISAERLAQYANRPVAASDQKGEQGQTVLSLPAATVDRIVGDKQPQSAPSARVAAALGQVRPSQAKDQQKHLVAATQRSVQVFFVLDDLSVAQSQSPLPAASPPPEKQTRSEVKSGARHRRPVIAPRPAPERVPARRTE